MKRTRPGLGSKAASVLAVAVSLSAAGYGYGFAGADPQAPAGVRSYLVITAPGDINGAVQAVTANGGKVQNSYAPIGVVIAHSAATDFATRMRAVTGVQKVGQTRETDVPATGQTAAAAGKDSTARRYLEKQMGAAIAAPSEPVEWNMLQMGADKAWAINPGSRTVTVGVLDTGVQGTHEDLRDNFDAANSVSCLYGKPNTTPGAWEPDSYAPAAGHGTSVAGIIAAAKNGKGVIGVAPNVRVASVKVMEPTGYMYAENVVCGLMWSAERGFKVTNQAPPGPRRPAPPGWHGSGDAVPSADRRGAAMPGAAWRRLPAAAVSARPAADPAAAPTARPRRTAARRASGRGGAVHAAPGTSRPSAGGRAGRGGPEVRGAAWSSRHRPRLRGAPPSGRSRSARTARPAAFCVPPKASLIVPCSAAAPPCRATWPPFPAADWC